MKITARLARSAAKELAHTIDPDLDTITTWTRTCTLVDLEALYRSAAWAEQIATSIHGTTRTQLLDQRHRLDDVARHARSLQRLLRPRLKNQIVLAAVHDQQRCARTLLRQCHIREVSA